MNGADIQGSEQRSSAAIRGLQCGRIVLWTTIAALMAIPAVAMRFANEVDWSGGDFAIAAVLLGGLGLGLELVTRSAARSSRKWWAAIALFGAVLLTWANLAVGILGADSAGINAWDYAPVAALLAFPLLLLRQL